MKKRILCMLMIAAMAVMCLAGCKKDNGTDTGKDGETVTAAPADNGSQGSASQNDPAPEPAATSEPVKAQGTTYADGRTSPVAGGAADFSADELAAEGITVVASAEELIAAIRPGARIVIAPGRYNLSDYTEAAWDQAPFFSDEDAEVRQLTDWVYLRDCYDGHELYIQDVDGLVISGGTEDHADTELVIDPRYATIMSFNRCTDVDIFNLTMGHTDRGGCEGNVIDMARCHDIRFHNSDLYGCGVYGLGIFRGSSDIYVYSSIVRDCSCGFLHYDEGTGKVEFYDSVMTGSYGMWYTATRDSSLLFDNCVFGKYESSIVAFRDDIETRNCTFAEDLEYPEYPEDPEYYDVEQPVFDLDRFIYAGYDDEVMYHNTEWIEYGVGRYEDGVISRDVRLMPYYDVDADRLETIGMNIWEYEADRNFGLYVQDQYFGGTWDDYGSGLILYVDDTYSEDLPETIFAQLFIDKYTGRAWMEIAIDDDHAYWMYGSMTSVDYDYGVPEEYIIRYIVNDMNFYEIMNLDANWGEEFDVGFDDAQMAIAAALTLSGSSYDNVIDEEEDYEGETVWMEIGPDPDKIEFAAKQMFGKNVPFKSLPVKAAEETVSTIEAYRHADGTPVIFMWYAENDMSYSIKNLDITRSGSGYVVTKDLYYGYWGYDPAYAEYLDIIPEDMAPFNYTITYTIEPSEDSLYGYVIRGMHVKYLGEGQG